MCQIQEFQFQLGIFADNFFLKKFNLKNFLIYAQRFIQIDLSKLVNLYTSMKFSKIVKSIFISQESMNIKNEITFTILKDEEDDFNEYIKLKKTDKLLFMT